jgi:hypothetical protein
MADVLCPTCGRPNSDHREFCDFCGNPLDGALRVEDDGVSQDQGLLDNLTPDSMDDAARLNNLVPAPEEDKGPPAADSFFEDTPLSEDSRLESYFTEQDDPIDEPSEDDSTPTDRDNGGSRLDDYLLVDDSVRYRETEELEDIHGEDASQEDDYLTPERPEEQIQLETQHLLDDQEKEESSRLDEYLAPESPEDERLSDDAARLNEFFADDPFTDPSPPPSESIPEKSEPTQSSLLSRKDLLSDSSTEEPPAELEYSQLSSEEELPKEAHPSESPDPSEWDSLEATTSPEEAGEKTSPESLDDGEWDFLDPTSTPEQDDEVILPEAIDPGEWDYLDPSLSQEQEDEISPEAIDPGEWNYLDPSPTPKEEGEEEISQPIAPEEKDLPEVSPTPQPQELSSIESEESEEWDFFDPPPDQANQQEKDSSPSGTDPETSDDWSFLDPGPTDDLSDKVSEQEYQAEGVDEDAGWLDMLQDPGSRPTPEPEPSSTTEPQKPQTDWLEKIRRLNKSSDLVDEDSSFPDWLSVTGQTAEFKGQDSEESPDEVPEWLKLDDDESLNEFLRKKDLSNEEYKPKFTTDSLDETVVLGDPDQPAKDLSDSQQIKFPSWADQQKEKKGKPDAEERADISISAKPLQIEDEHFDDLFSEELPSWLTEASSGELDRALVDDLAQGELPGWVEAMRPVVESTDASGLDEDEEYIENYGPLAGIPSVLPAEAEIGIDVDQDGQKPLNLIASKSHQNYVDLLKTLIGDENTSKSVRLPSPMGTQRVLRWLIAIVMLVTVTVTVLFSGSFEVISPTAAQLEGTGISALYEEIETLYDGQPVLIAFDYQPGSAGELYTAAATVVDHLMEEGTYLSFISTQPTGPALAEHFLDTTQSHHNYIHTQKYINLGYLPGQSAGLMSFMIAPQKIIPLAFDGSNAWDSPPLISVDNVNDFKMILVITDDPNTARIWIEQVGSRLDDTPLTMVVSAQVEPLIQPYFRTSPQQVKGYVAGIIDSINYELLIERPYLANRIWLPFNMGIIISVGIIFISGLANGVLSLFTRRKDKLKGDST